MEKSKNKAESALYQFSQRYAAAFFSNHPPSERSIQTVRDAVREQYEQEQTGGRKSVIEPPVIESPIKPKEHEQEPPQQGEPER